MAELDIGQHCSFDECHQLDFILHFTCNRCHLIFCKEHRLPDSHACRAEPGDAGEPGEGGRGGKSRGVPASVPCGFGGCGVRELTPVCCEHCEGHFCLGHRHQQDHACQRLQTKPDRMQQTAALVQGILESRSDTAPSQPSLGSDPPGAGRQRPKSKATADKVALMKLKMKAIGQRGIPDKEKIYLQIFARDCSGKSLIAEKTTNKSGVTSAGGVAMVFSRVWTVGRVIDGVASTLSISNKNNIASASRLRLFTTPGGERLSLDWTLERCEAGESALHNGGSVILTSVGDDVQTLTDVAQYMKPS